MTGKTDKDYEKTYTEPKLREKLKEEIKEGDKGGKAGQWSARKSQLLTKEYEKEGGGYKDSGHKTDAQKSLSQWTKEDWQSADHKVAIRGEDETVRYLPKAVWDQLSSKEKTETNKIKVAGSHKGKQKVDNPDKVKEILAKVRKKKS